LIVPFRLSTTIHASVRARTLVQNGISTAMLLFDYLDPGKGCASSVGSATS
jgi:hypothetical protein